MGGRGEGFSGTHKGHMDKTKVGWKQEWEVGMAGVEGERWG